MTAHLPGSPTSVHDQAGIGMMLAQIVDTPGVELLRIELDRRPAPFGDWPDPNARLWRLVLGRRSPIDGVTTVHTSGNDHLDVALARLADALNSTIEHSARHQPPPPVLDLAP